MERGFYPAEGDAIEISDRSDRRRVLGPAFEFLLAAQDGAPLLVLSYRHPALHADSHTWLGWLGPAEQAFQQ
jgi:hypothetical protein